MDYAIYKTKHGYLNADGSKDDEFSSTYPTSTNTSERISFYIAKL